jgi:hypothetical protein
MQPAKPESLLLEVFSSSRRLAGELYTSAVVVNYSFEIIYTYTFGKAEPAA